MERVTKHYVLSDFDQALEEEQFAVYYQPIYNHSTGLIVGLEALVRWIHPVYGRIPPLDFIPVLEQHELITKLDLYVIRQVCRFLRERLDESVAVVPVSFNLTRQDIFYPGFVDELEAIRQEAGVPMKYLRAEITESSAMGSVSQVNRVIKKMHDLGCVVEMDDFGSGFSSLNVLKDLDVDIIKLDMDFLSSGVRGRGGTIVSSIVRMAKWLSMPVIAEGVETAETADFMRSIGCDYVQGYLYSRPLPEAETRSLLIRSGVSFVLPSPKADTVNAANFWDPHSQETLIFNQYVGGAAVFDYYKGIPELLRVNSKYVQEIGMNMEEKDIIMADPWKPFDAENRKIYEAALAKAIETGEEQECETWRRIESSCCGEELLCIRSNLRLIARSDDRYLFHVSVRNVTAEKQELRKLYEQEARFKHASEQANIYYWEYNVATKEMRPCFRCMRDLGLPMLVNNYPEPAIEKGIIPQDYADQYRDWHRRIAEGEPELEGVIPLTVGRVPFRVRYTTAFDEQGRPIKAYGSATLIVE